LNPDAWALAFVGLACVLTLARHAGIDIPKHAEVGSLALSLAALMFEGSTVRSGMHALWEARIGGVVLNGTIWLAAFGFAMFNWPWCSKARWL
jgi:hypothetical protein